ncbi:TetR/AcrR family transcriptional regulator [Paenibacillus farraposensis]|nr:TetR/AcrR family transcriptional regulator [Paenibacillus farraposensis]MCC3379646.1 TetR/AcrR family transcriptional regulator [Paenibacillus farraposensis]
MKNDKANTDLRVKRTHKLLWSALGELLLDPKKEFSSITINEICEKAMVHRTTFYKHFVDKYDLLNLFFLQFQDEFRKNSLEDRIEIPFQTIERNPKRKMMDIIALKQKNDKTLMNFYKNHIKEVLMLDFLELKQRGKKFEIPIEIIAEFYASTISSLNIWWIQNRGNVSAVQMDEYFNQMTNKSLFSIRESS